MLARAAFWTALAIAFVLLALVAWRERKKIKGREFPIPAPGLEHFYIMKPVADGLTNILRVEAIGFVLAAVAAAYEALV